MLLQRNQAAPLKTIQDDDCAGARAHSFADRPTTARRPRPKQLVRAVGTSQVETHDVGARPHATVVDPR